MPTGMNGISLAGNNQMCEIRFDTTQYSSNKRLIRKAKRKIHKKGKTGYQGVCRWIADTDYRYGGGYYLCYTRFYIICS